MINFSQKLLTNLEQQLNLLHTNNEETVKYAQKGIKLTITAMEELKAFFCNYQFSTKAAEIEFFKEIKPKFAAKLIYYNELYNIEIAKLSGSNKTVKKYYKNQLRKTKTFFKENTEFYKYHRSGSTCLDKKYFLRGKHDIRLTLDSFYFQSDYSFATSHDYKVSQIIANEAIQLYLTDKLNNFKAKVFVEQEENFKPLKWTGSKVALVELMYALHATGAIENGNLTLKEVAKSMEAIFDIKLGQFNRIYLEIRNRKTIEKTHFLDILRENLIKSIDNADEK